MSNTQLIVFIAVLVFLVLLAAFFSAAETALMAVNHYRLRHKARLKKRTAMMTLKLLKRPDRLLGTILIVGNFANILASSIATIVAIHFWGDKGVIFSTALLTLTILIFAEVAPKTVAALHPEGITHIVAWPVTLLLKLFYPIVWLINFLSNGFLRLFGVKVKTRRAEPLTREELRTVVVETAGRISSQYQNMLLGILDLSKLTIEDVIIPSHAVVGIDLDSSWEDIQRKIALNEYDWLPVYRESIQQVVGMLHVREMIQAMLKQPSLTKEMLISVLHEPYYVPEGTPLNIQLLHFQKQKKRIALVVNEYGEVQGLLTLQDILEEIVGEFTTDVASTSKIAFQKDGSFLVDGATTVREFNRVTSSKLPTKGARTISGLIIDFLEMIPTPGTCVKIADYPVEILIVKDNRVKSARVFPKLTQEEPTEFI